MVLNGIREWVRPGWPRKILSSLCLAASILIAGAPLAARTAVEADAETPAHEVGIRDELRRIIGEARDRVFPALVSIRVVTVRFSQGQELKGQSVGSGTIISPEGYVLTNQHVVQHGRKFVCTLSDKREVDAELVGEDPLTDLALLKLDKDDLEKGGGELPAASFGNSDQLEIGDYVMAMGSPFSLSRSVSLGIVSNTERVFAGGFGSDEVGEMELEQGQRTGLFTRWIQHDAIINPGNSGGPLVNLAGEVVGVNELGGSSMGFAIPSKLAEKVAQALIDHGEVQRSWIGLSFKPIQRTGLEEGALINSVVVDGPAAQAGIAAGDVLLALGGEPVTVRFTEEVPLLLDRVASLPIGETISLEIRHDGEVKTVEMKTRKLEKDLGEEVSFHAWGLTGQAITSKMASDLRLAVTDGVLVSGVRQGGPAQLAEPPLAYGDVIRAVDGRTVKSLDELIELYRTLTEEETEEETEEKNEKEELLVELDRQGKNQLTLLEPRDDDQHDPPRELPKAWIGVATQPVLPDLAAQLGLGVERGFRITRVYPNTAAAQSELTVGDIVVAVNGEEVMPSGMQDIGLLNRKVRSLDIGDQANLTVLRDSGKLDVAVELERTRIAPDEARRHRDSDFELAVRELTFFDRDENRWDQDVNGVLVEQVESAGWAGLGGVRAFDLVLRINDRAIRGLKSFREALQEIKREQPEKVVMVVLRGVKTHFQYLEPEWTPTDQP